jgi:lipopolysaccharide export system permease protein
MTLYNGVMMEVPNKKPAELTRLFYKRDRLRVKNVFGEYQASQTGTVSKGDREMSVCEMQRELSRADLLVRQARFDIAMAEWERSQRRDKKPDTALPNEGTGLGGLYCRLLSLFDVKKAEAQSPPVNPLRPSRVQPDTGQLLADTVGYRARLQDAQFRMQDARRQRDRYDVEIQKKFSLAAACVVFVIVGAPIALRFPRGGVGLVIGVSFAIFGLYYVGLIGGETLADKGYLPPWLAMWIANLLLLAIGLGLVSRMGRESTTSRGGDFTELLLTARARTLGWLRRIGVPIERRRK